MTSEIAILNPYAVALAADSAVTLSNLKVYNTATKIFRLAEHVPVGVMVYGQPNIMNVPIEVLLKLYSEKLKLEKFQQLQDYCEGFFEFIESGEVIPKKVQNDCILAQIKGIFGILISETKKDFELPEHKEKLNGDGGNKCSILLDILDAKLTKLIEEQKKSIQTEFEIDAEEIEENFSENIDQIMQEVFGECEITDSVREKFILFLKYRLCVPESGIVFAGFGEKELFPMVKAYLVGPLINRKWWRVEDKVHSRAESVFGSQILPYAQGEMVFAFMNGIHPHFDQTLGFYLTSLFNNGLADATMTALKKHLSVDEELEGEIHAELKSIYSQANEAVKINLQKYSTDYFVSPILSVLDSLPKSELIEMAENLVNLTSFRRKMSSDQATVGGPIDVAIISKSDGFMWVKKKGLYNSITH